MIILNKLVPKRKNIAEGRKHSVTLYGGEALVPLTYSVIQESASRWQLNHEHTTSLNKAIINMYFSIHTC